ncbi:hypothetical protein [Enterococcus sp.]|jgi:hypothetical protein|uniref:hypothetical protein n=1 Tax=Enterococcus sp. TaxID=35783 RepID=UPI00289D516A|nr:hypothetical protein [Enterococcus sp.]
MNRSVFRYDLVKELYSWKTIFMVTLFSFYVSTYLSTGYQLALTAIEFMIMLITDHYYILYIFLALYIFATNSVKKKQRAFVMIRCKNYLYFWLQELLNSALLAIFMVGLHLFTIGMISFLHFPATSDFSGNPTPELPLDVYREKFSSPIITLAVVSLFLIMGLIFFTVIIRWMEHYISQRSIHLVTWTIYLSGIIGLQMGWDEHLPYLFINNYLMLHHAIARDALFNILIVQLLVLGGALYCLKNGKGIKNYE